MIGEKKGMKINSKLRRSLEAKYGKIANEIIADARSLQDLISKIGQKDNKIEVENTFEEFFNNNFDYKIHPLQLQIAEWFMSRLYDPKCERQMIATRKIGKTDIITIACVVWTLLKDPNYRFIILTKSDASLKVINKSIRDKLGKYGVIEDENVSFINVKGREIGNKANSVRFLTAGSKKRGLRGDHIIMDDLVDASDSSAAIRQETLVAYSEAKALVPPSTLIGQLSHEDDLPSTLEKAGVETWRISIHDVPDDLKKAIKLESVEEMQKTRPLRYIGHNYELHHYKDSNLQYFADIAVAKFRKSPNHYYAVVDPSFGGRDKTGLVVMSYIDDLIYAYAKEMSFNFRLEDDVLRFLEFAASKGIKKVIVEKNNGGDTLFSVSTVVSRIQQLDLDIILVHNSQSKVDRILGLMMYKQLIRLDERGDNQNIWSWEKDVTIHSLSSDDCLDALSTGVAELKKSGILYF